MSSAEVFVGRLALSVTEADLTRLFAEECGQVKRVYIAPCLPSGRSMYTFGFVEFEEDDAAVKAINIHHGQFFHGFVIRVEACRKSSLYIHSNSNVIHPANDRTKQKHLEEQAVKDEAEQRMLHVKKCYADVVGENPERNMLSLKDFMGYVDREKYCLAEPFTHQVRPIHLNLHHLHLAHAELSSKRPSVKESVEKC